jgi:branched-chain amino acid aminotransferase
MAVKVFIDGTVCDPEAAMVPVTDRGFLYGDSVYEVMRTAGGKPVGLDAHLDRLEHSAAALALRLPERSHIADAIAETLAAAANPESYVRVIVTRGSGKIGLDTALADRPRLVIMVRPLERPPAATYRDGVRLQLVHLDPAARRAVAPGIKTGNYLTNIMAMHEARSAGADDALIVDVDGRVSEGSSFNVFVVRGERVITPARHVGLLAGITRERVIELARASGIDVIEGVLIPDDVREADEMFITSTIRGVVPVASVDGVALARPVVGPITRRITRLYEDYLAAQARA